MPAKDGFVAGVLLVALASLASACSSEDEEPAQQESTPSERPTADLSFADQDGFAWDATKTSVRCSFPVLDGLSVAVLTQAPDASGVRVSLTDDDVTVVLSEGSGEGYTERTFEGTGITSFDAADGATIDSELTETEAPDAPPKGDLGVVTAVDGEIDCGDQTTGSSTLTISGDTPAGTLDNAELDPVRVECAELPDGDEVYASGLVEIGATRAHVGLGLTSAGEVRLELTLPTGAHDYNATSRAEVTKAGASVDADTLEENASPPRALHVEGDVTCGRHAAG
jgi:hypothetical protein